MFIWQVRVCATGEISRRQSQVALKLIMSTIDAVAASCRRVEHVQLAATGGVSRSQSHVALRSTNQLQPVAEEWNMCDWLQLAKNPVATSRKSAYVDQFLYDFRGIELQ